MSSALPVTDADFDTNVLASDVPVLVDFWAPWCGPCRMLAPILDEVAALYDGRLKVLKMNTEENSATAAKLGIRALPTLMLFKNGALEETKTGLLSNSQLCAFLDSNI